MGLVKVITFNNGRIKDLKSNINRMAKLIKHGKRDVKFLNDRVEYLKVQYDITRNYLVEAFHGDIGSYDELVFNLRAYKNGKFKFTSNIHSIKSKIANWQKRLTNYKLELLKAEPDTSQIVLSDVVKAMSNSKFVKKETIRLYQKGNIREIRLRLCNVITRPSKNQYLFINGGRPITWKLPDLDIRICLNRGDVNCKATPGNGKYRASGYMTGVYPHLDDDDGNACLGSYGPIIVEAIDNKDWLCVIDNIVTWLSTIDVTDISGKYWPLYYIKHCHNELTIKFDRVSLTHKRLTSFEMDKDGQRVYIDFKYIDGKHIAEIIDIFQESALVDKRLNYLKNR